MERDAEKLEGHEELLVLPLDDRSLRESRERHAAKLRLLWKRRSFLTRMMLVGTVLGIVAAFSIQNRYTSTVRLMPPDQSSGGGAALLESLGRRIGGSFAGLAGSALGMNTNGALFVGVLKSATVEDDVISKFHLQRIYSDRYMEDARTELAKRTSISQAEKSGIISVSVTDQDPHRAAAMAEEYVDELNWVVTHLSTSAAHRERAFLDERLAQVKSHLEDDEQQFSEFASQKGAPDIPEQSKAMVTSAAALQGRLIAAESELQALRQIYTDSNVHVRSMRAQVNNLQKALENLGGRGASEDTDAQGLYPSLKELPLLGVKYADLLRRTKVQEAVFEALTEEDESAKVEEAKEIPTVKVLDPAEVPAKESFPPRTLIVALGAISGIAVGAAWLASREAWTAMDVSDPRKKLAQEVWMDVRGRLPWSSNGSGSVHSDGGI